MVNVVIFLEILRGFILKIEDFYCLMNFFEVLYLCFKIKLLRLLKIVGFFLFYYFKMDFRLGDGYFDIKNVIFRLLYVVGIIFVM